MRIRVFATGLVLCLYPVIAVGGDEKGAEGAIDRVLSTFHQAASDADGEVYFSLFAEDAIFMGTDATERWSVEEFKAFAEPYFSEGRGWTYTTVERHVEVAPDRGTAWFDEILWNETYGTCRGTGVLIHTGTGWRIAQYNLTIPIPNELAAELTARIKAHGGGK